MRWSIVLMLALVFLATAALSALPAASVAQAAVVVAAAADCPKCAAAKPVDGWCDDCGVGFVDGEKVACKTCYAARTADGGGWCQDCGVGYAAGVKTKCKTCVKAIQSDSFCAECKVGYVTGVKTACKTCHALMLSKDGGWCDDCGVGHAKGLDTKCKDCLKAIQGDGFCADCGVGYATGVKTKCKTCHALMLSKEGGWCDDCQNGHVGALTLKCRSCFDAAKKDGACETCGIAFADGKAYRRLSFHAHGDAKADVLRQAVADLPGVRNAKVDAKAKPVRIDLELEDGGKTKPRHIVKALAAAGVEAHAGAVDAAGG